MKWDVCRTRSVVAIVKSFFNLFFISSLLRYDENCHRSKQMLLFVRDCFNYESRSSIANVQKNLCSLIKWARIKWIREKPTKKKKTPQRQTCSISPENCVKWKASFLDNFANCIEHSFFCQPLTNWITVMFKWTYNFCTLFARSNIKCTYLISVYLRTESNHMLTWTFAYSGLHIVAFFSLAFVALNRERDL